MTKKCCHCDKEIVQYLNYCSWECQIEEARLLNGKVIAPNDLPITCIRCDGTLMEHEEADHRDYKFPVTVVWRDVPEDLLNEPLMKNEYFPESHALIYNDEFVALTLYECCYHLWYLKDGESNSIRSRKNPEPRQVLSVESIQKIKDSYLHAHHRNTSSSNNS